MSKNNNDNRQLASIRRLISKGKGRIEKQETDKGGQKNNIVSVRIGVAPSVSTQARSPGRRRVNYLPNVIPQMIPPRLVSKVEGTRYFVADDGTVFAALKATLAGTREREMYNLAIDGKVVHVYRSSLQEKVKPISKK